MIYLSNYSINLNPHGFALEPAYNASANVYQRGREGAKPSSGLNTERVQKPRNFQPKHKTRGLLLSLLKQGEGLNILKKPRATRIPGSKVDQRIPLGHCVKTKPFISKEAALFKKKWGQGINSKPLLCWHSDVALLNLRHWFLNLLRAMHLLWTTGKNNGRVMLINHGNPLAIEAHQNNVDRLMLCQLSPTLRRQASSKQANQPGIHFGSEKAKPNAKPLPLANSNVNFTKLTQLTQFKAKEAFKEEAVSRVDTDNHTLFKARLWIKFYQLSSRLVTCTYEAVKMGWFSNSFASNYVWNPLMLYDRSSLVFKGAGAQSRLTLPMGAIRSQDHATTKRLPFHLFLQEQRLWFKLSKGLLPRSPQILAKRATKPLKKNIMALGFANPNFFSGKRKQGSALAVLRFCSDVTNTTAAKNYIKSFYKSTVEPTQFALIQKRRRLYDALSTDRKSTQHQLCAKNILLGQINVVVFSHPENSAKLVQQARNLNIPTIGLCGGFAQKNQLISKPNQYRQWVDFPIIANPNNHDNVTMLFCKFTKISLTSLKHTSFRK